MHWEEFCVPFSSCLGGISQFVTSGMKLGISAKFSEFMLVLNIYLNFKYAPMIDGKQFSKKNEREDLSKT